MSIEGWRTLIVRAGGELRLKEDHIILAGEQEMTVPIDQVARVIIAKPSVLISAALLVELAARGIRVVLCDPRYLPACEVTGLGLHNEAAGLLMDQAGWRQEAKDAAWAFIVRAKIGVQARLLECLRLAAVVPLASYAQDVRAGDPTNREAMAARVYFSALFGREFHRNAGGPVNAALNYGYAILLSEFSRTLAMHGYCNALGIHHCRRDNRLNLPCDLMEPFRPFVDAMVKAHGEQELTWEYKKELIAVTHAACRYGQRRMDLSTAIEAYVLDAMRSMAGGTNEIKEIDFAQPVWRDHGSV